MPRDAVVHFQQVMGQHAWIQQLGDEAQRRCGQSPDGSLSGQDLEQLVAEFETRGGTDLRGLLKLIR